MMKKMTGLSSPATALLLLATSSPSTAHSAGRVTQTDHPLAADSAVGQRLLQQANVVVESSYHHPLRRAADQQQYQYQYDNQYGVSNLNNLYIQYQGCSSFLAPDQGDNGGSGDGINYYYYPEGGYQQQDQQQQAQQEDEYGNVVYNDGIVQQNLVRFTLCSKSNCGSCSGEYVVDMSVFLDAYTEMQMEGDEYQCEYVREHCYCSNGYYETCLSTCYTNAGLDDCMQEYYGGESFQLQEYIECTGTSNGASNGCSFYQVSWNSYLTHVAAFCPFFSFP